APADDRRGLRGRDGARRARAPGGLPLLARRRGGGHRAASHGEERRRRAPRHDQGDALAAAARLHRRGAGAGGRAPDPRARPRAARAGRARAAQAPWRERASYRSVSRVIEPKFARAVSSISARTVSTAFSKGFFDREGRPEKPTFSNSSTTSRTVTRF